MIASRRANAIAPELPPLRCLPVPAVLTRSREVSHLSKLVWSLYREHARRHPGRPLSVRQAAAELGAEGMSVRHCLKSLAAVGLVRLSYLSSGGLRVLKAEALGSGEPL